MEGILSLIGVFVGYVVINLVWRFAIATMRAGGRTVLGHGNFKENLDLSINGMRPLEMRMVDSPFDEKPNSPIVKAVEVKGLFPIQLKTNLQFLISVLDITNKNDVKPVLAMLENFQEVNTLAYQHGCRLGDMSVGYGFTKWVRIGVIVPEIIQPPIGGLRSLSAIVRLVDFNNPPTIRHGFHSGDHPGQLWIEGQHFDYKFNGKGYEEAVEDQEECNVLAIHLTMAVAVADGKIEDSEGAIIRTWIKKLIAMEPERFHTRLKEKYNSALSYGYANAIQGNLNISEICSKVNKKGDKRVKYEIVELCFDVMAADHQMSANELKLINSIAESLELNLSEIQKIRDLKIVKVQATSGSANIEDLIGIQPDWDREKIDKHLREEFNKWNNRLNTLPEGPERENAQKMLNAIAEARRNKRAS